MDIESLTQKAQEVREIYDQLKAQKGRNAWGAREYTEGLVGDVGDLMKLVQAKENYRRFDDVDSKLAHELSDILWCTLLIAKELNIDLEKEFITNMEQLKKEILKDGQSKI